MSLIKILKLVGGSIIEMPLEIVGRQLEFYQQRKNAAHDQKLRQEEAQFIQDLEMERQKFNAELEDLIAQKEIERGTKILDTIKDYQITMAESVTSISNSLGKMTIELRRQAHDLMEEKKRSYKQLQTETQNEAIEQLEKIYAKFPEGSRARKIMEDSVNEQMIVIVESSKSFMKMIDADFAKMTENLDLISRQASENANEYISMTLGQLMPNKLRGGDTKLLK